MLFCAHPLQIVIHGTAPHVGGMNILIGLCQVSSQDLPVGMPISFWRAKISTLLRSMTRAFIREVIFIFGCLSSHYIEFYRSET